MRTPGKPSTVSAGLLMAFLAAFVLLGSAPSDGLDFARVRAVTTVVRPPPGRNLHHRDDLRVQHELGRLPLPLVRRHETRSPSGRPVPDPSRRVPDGSDRSAPAGRAGREAGCGLRRGRRARRGEPGGRLHCPRATPSRQVLGPVPIQDLGPLRNTSSGTSAGPPPGRSSERRQERNPRHRRLLEESTMNANDHRPQVRRRYRRRHRPGVPGRRPGHDLRGRARPAPGDQPARRAADQLPAEGFGGPPGRGGRVRRAAGDDGPVRPRRSPT